MFSPDGYQALTEHAAVVRRGDRGVLVVTGTDRLSWLQGLLTNDVLALPMGGVCDAAYLTPQGRMITDMRVFNLSDRVLLDVPASLAESLQSRMDGLLFAEDAQVANRSSELSIVEVHGPDAPAIVQGLDVSRDDWVRLPGFTSFVPVADVELFVRDMTARGAPEISLETLDVVRVEAGRPAFLVDMDEQTIPLEAGLESRAISFTKGCYVGQEVIVRVTHRGGGRVARKLVGIRLSKGTLPKGGERIRSGEREIGRLTSVAWSPALEAGIALGYVHRDFTSPGTVVNVGNPRAQLSGELSPLPFIRRESQLG
ncbi:MAG TPA: glycine cleavage T C-terminal barrel domain-containing protein [Vicinamibacterales bacterium]|nr:glycine cleavage T C-terminal barrel domain-containing protein [Vicinamibacterales bacterium]